MDMKTSKNSSKLKTGLLAGSHYESLDENEEYLTIRPREEGSDDTVATGSTYMSSKQFDSDIAWEMSDRETIARKNSLRNRHYLGYEYSSNSRFKSGKQLESMDFDRFDSQVRLHHLDIDSKRRHWFSIDFKRWLLTFVVALGTASAAVGVNLLTRQLIHWKYSAAESMIDDSSVTSQFLVWLVYATISLCYTLCAVLLVVTFSMVAAGSGIPEIKCLLNGIKVPYVTRILTLFVKGLGVTFAVASGLPVGKEGPMIHMGAVVGAGLSQGKSTTCGVDTGFSKLSEFRNDAEKRDFISCGAAAGVAAAFGAPIGGVMFCLEEGASFWNPGLTWRTLFAGMSAMVFTTLLSSGEGELSSSGILSFGSFTHEFKETYEAWEIIPFVLMGALGGLIGAFFNKVQRIITEYRMKHHGNIYQMKGKWKKVAESLIISFMVSTTAVLLPMLYGASCIKYETCIHEKYSFDNTTTIQFFCPDGQFDRVASLAFSPSEEVIKYLFHAPSGCGPPASMLTAYFIIYTILMCTTYGLPVPSGLFVPGILSGAVYGRLVWIALRSFLSSAFHNSSVGIYALVGAASILGGVTRICIALTVILIECTGNMQLSVPIMAAVLAARWAGDLFNEGIYDIHIELQGQPFLPFETPSYYSNTRVSRIMTQDPLILRPIERAGNILDVLSSTDHNAFPVVAHVRSIEREHDSSPRQARKTGLNSESVSTRQLVGLMLRKHLCVLLSEEHKERVLIDKHRYRESGNIVVPEPGWHGSATEDEEKEDAPLRQGRRMRTNSGRLLKPQLSWEALEGRYPRYLPYSELSDEEKAMWVDLRPYMHETPHTIEETAVASQVFSQFRSMGLRHMVAVNKTGDVVGIVTRKDIVPHAVKEVVDQDGEGHLHSVDILKSPRIGREVVTNI